MSWTEYYSPKYEKKITLPQLIFKDADLFFWLYEENKFTGKLAAEAKDIYRKACSIRIPDSQEVEYDFYPKTGYFTGFELVPRSLPSHIGSTRTSRNSVLDMSIVRKRKQYDKMGYQMFIRRMKLYFFENKPLTKKKCEEFFENNDNFSI